MTIKKYIQTKLMLFGAFFPEDYLKSEILLTMTNPEEEVNFENKKQAKECLYNIIPDLLLLPNSISEGGYSVSYDKEALLKLYSSLSKELGYPDLLKDKQPKVKNISNRF